MRIEHYRTEWQDTDNYIFLACSYGHIVGCLEMTKFKKGEDEGKAYVWNLHIDKPHRKQGYANQLMKEAITTAKDSGCTNIIVDWERQDSPQWVLDWYVRLGFNEKSFGRGGCTLEKKL